MKKTEMAKQAMFKTVLRVLDDNPASWSNYAPISTEVTSLRQLVKGIDDDLQTQTGTASNGFTTQKTEAIEAMLELAYRMAVKLKVWAKKQHNPVVYNAAKYYPSSLGKDTYTEQVSRCKLILSKGEENKGALVDYQITAEKLAALQVAIEQAETLSIDRSAIGIAHQSATSNISVKVKAAKAILTDLDDLVTGFTEEKDAPFVAAYKAARKTVRYHSSADKNAPVQKTEGSA